MHAFHIQTIQQIVKLTKGIDETVSDESARWIVHFCGPSPLEVRVDKMDGPFYTGRETSFSWETPHRVQPFGSFYVDPRRRAVRFLTSAIRDGENPHRDASAARL